MVQKVFLAYPENMAYLRKRTSRVRLTRPGVWGFWVFALGFQMVFAFIMISNADGILLIVGICITILLTFIWGVLEIINLNLLKKHGRVVKGTVSIAGKEAGVRGIIVVRYTFLVPGTQDVIEETVRVDSNVLPPESGTSVAVLYGSKKIYRML